MDQPVGISLLDPQQLYLWEPVHVVSVPEMSIPISAASSVKMPPGSEMVAITGPSTAHKNARIPTKPPISRVAENKRSCLSYGAGKYALAMDARDHHVQSRRLGHAEDSTGRWRVRYLCAGLHGCGEGLLRACGAAVLADPEMDMQNLRFRRADMHWEVSDDLFRAVKQWIEGRDMDIRDFLARPEVDFVALRGELLEYVKTWLEERLNKEWKIANEEGRR
ncbi:hypothetical protein LZ554_005747 [Drepanopeziza brunnea f. sp. 'monogermtubi']|nr:hypothetical protein LZ554_005747 [Drepanopeziza brunnea f. sp. 'monogermtubi']